MLDIARAVLLEAFCYNWGHIEDRFLFLPYLCHRCSFHLYSQDFILEKCCFWNTIVLVLCAKTCPLCVLHVIVLPTNGTTRILP